MPAFSLTGRYKADLVLFWLCVAVLVMALDLLFVHGFAEIQRQHRVNRTYIPVDATVLSGTVNKYHESKGATHYVPKIAYEYQVEAKRYTSDRFRAVYVWGDEDWANAVVARYPVEQTCRAFYDPAKPDEAVLVKGYSFSPYFDCLEAVFCVTGSACMTLCAWFQRKRQPLRTENGWSAIVPQFTEHGRLQVALCCSLLWYGLGALVVIHYLYCVPPPHPIHSVRILEGFAALGVIPLAFTGRYFLVTRNLSDARLVLNELILVPGREFKFAISQQARQQISLSTVHTTLRCTGIKVRGRSRNRTVLHEENPIDLKNQTLHPGESLEVSGAFMIKPDLPPSGRDASGKYNWIEWEITLRCKVSGAPDYKAIFPLDVRPAPFEQPEIPANLPARARVEIRKIDSRPGDRILSKRHIAMVYAISLSPVPFLLLGMGLMFVAYPTVFKDPTFHSPIVLSQQKTLALFVLGSVLVLATSLGGLIFPNAGNAYLRAVATRILRNRPDALVNPQANDSRFVQIIPRSNWNRLMLENASDTGFLVVDHDRREIRFEGDHERYRIPVEAIQSCTLEKSLAMQSAQPGAPGIWLVVIRAYGESGLWEAPFADRCKSGRALRKSASITTKEFYAEIHSLLPKAAETVT